MSSQSRKVDVVRLKVFSVVGVVVLVGIFLFPSHPSLYARLQAWNAKRYCEAVLASGATFGAAQDDYLTQLKICERNPNLAHV